MTVTFQVTAHVGDAGYRTPLILKFLSLPVPKIWLIFGHGVTRPDDLHLSPYDL